MVDDQFRVVPGSEDPRLRAFPSLYQMIQQRARMDPSGLAILAPGRNPLTYGGLLNQVQVSTQALRNLGVRPRDRIAVVMPNGPEMAVALIAVAAGASCVPLNPGFATDEWLRYFTHLRVKALLSVAQAESTSRVAARTIGMPIIDLVPLTDAAAGVFRLTESRHEEHEERGEEPFGRSEDDAFVLPTSGTTARPKGVPLTHANICQSAHNAGASLCLGARDRLLNVLPFYHAHGLISGLCSGLAAGSSVVCTPGFDAADFFAWLDEFQPSWYTAVPAIHQAVLTEAPRHEDSIRRCSLRLIRSASASLPPSVLSQLEKVFGVPVIETYGMTEAASQIASNPLPPGRRKVGSVGRAAGPEIAVIGNDGRQLPPNQQGEIVLRGPNVARGYDGDHAANKAAFSKGWFRTGDLGYLDEDGYLFLVGRTREIINRGGQKIAPREVEDALMSHPEVAQVVVFPIPHARLGEDIAAAIVPRPTAKITARELRRFAAARLAPFKVPGQVHFVETIPESPTGKVQRVGLARSLGLISPRVSSARSARCVAPRTEVERQLAKTWAEVLEYDQVGVHEDFFALGGDSLAATQVISRMREQFDAAFTFKDLFDAPTIVELASRVEGSAHDGSLAPLSLRDQVPEGSPAHLSYPQERLYILNTLDLSGRSYHVLEVARLQGRIDRRALERSIATIIDRHEILRTTFIERKGELAQLIGGMKPEPLEFLDNAPCNEAKRTDAVRQVARAALRQPFDLSRGPLLRAKLLRLDDEDHALVLVLHHLVTDGWSQRLFWQELQELYVANVQNRLPSLPTLPIQYRHFAEWQRRWLDSVDAREQLSYWKTRLGGVSALPLRTDRPRPSTWSGRGARHPVKLSRALSRKLRSLSRSHGVTLFMTLLAAFQCLLYRYTEHDDIAVGSFIANRSRLDFEHLMGMFVNTVVLRTDLSGDPTFAEMLHRVRQVTLDTYRYQDLPIEKVLQALQVQRNVDRTTLIQVMIVLQNSPSKPPQLPGLTAEFVEVDPEIARFDLTLELIDTEGPIWGWIEYSTDLFDARTIRRMTGHYRTLLEGIVANPEERISRLPLLPQKERKRIISDWNDTEIGFPNGESVPEIIASQARRSPDAIAVSFKDLRLSYRELDRRSRTIADRLVQEGVGADKVVILLAERGIEILTGMIAVLHAGGAFLPLDPNLPSDRLLQIVEHSRAQYILTGRNFVPAVNQVLSRISTDERPMSLTLEDIVGGASARDQQFLRSAPTNLAYVIYTSGSTGVPKGAMIEHRGLLNHLCSKISDLGLTASDVIAQTAAQSFDISVWQFLTAILVGGRVHICHDEIVRDAELLAEETKRQGVTILQIVPSLLRALNERKQNASPADPLVNLRWMICTGEALPPELCRQWFHRYPKVPLLNAYGPAECADDVAIFSMDKPPPSSAENVPIGRPIANTRLYVLDAKLEPVPIGVTGELYVGGAGVGRGYLNDPEQTRQSFLPDPYSDDPGARLYKTGDLVLRLPDGSLEFLGRVDNQVKIRGFRIELEEIEHILLGRLDVSEAVVLVRNDLGGEDRLVAYVIAEHGHEPQVSELLNALKTKLPNYMVPSGFVFLESMPLTPHGKIDRQSLLAIREGIKTAGAAYVPSRNTTEHLLASIWADLLKAETVGAFDNFFDLGGHSLLAGQVLARVSDAFHVSLPLRTLFESPTISELALRIDEARQTPAKEPRLAIERVRGEVPRSASITQENVLQIESALLGLPAFNLPFAFKLNGPLDIEALERSFEEIMRRHEALRTGFVLVDDRLETVVTPPVEVGNLMKVEDQSLISTLNPDHVAESLTKIEAWKPFDMTQAPLLRVRLVRIGNSDHVLLVTIHHAIVDGWSIGIFFEEISEIYNAIVAGRKPELPAPQIEFSDFAHWQRKWCRSKEAEAQFTYWKKRLNDPIPSLFEGDDDTTTVYGFDTDTVPVHLPNDLIEGLTTLSRSRNSTLFMTLLAGFKVLLSGKTGRNDVCVATAMANRAQPDTAHMIGLFENTVLIRTRIDKNQAFQDLLQAVRESVLAAHENQELPFVTLVRRLKNEYKIDLPSCVQASFVMQDPIQRQLDLTDVAISKFGNLYREGQPVFPIDRKKITFMLKEASSGMLGSCIYSKDQFQPADIEQFVSDYGTILARVVSEPELQIARLKASVEP